MSTSKSVAMSVSEIQALEAVAKHPGLMPSEFGVLVPVAPSSVSALMSRLTRLRKVNRVKVPGSPAYRYYPKDAPLPEGHSEWSNALVKVNRPRGKGAKINGNGHDSQHALALAPAAPAPAEQRKTKGTLITLSIGERESITLSIEQAQDVFAQLRNLASLFGPQS
jgi:hypothetical protein